MKHLLAVIGPRPTILVLLLALLAWVPAADAANNNPCSALNAGPVTTISFGPVAFSASTTGPVGPVVNQGFVVWCPGNQAIQAQLRGGDYDPGTTTWQVPTGDPNLDVQIRLTWSAPSSEPVAEGNDLYDLGSFQRQTLWIANFSFQLIKKAGEVKPSQVPATLLDLLSTKNGEAVTITTVKIGAGTTIRSLSCVANSVTVRLPTITTQDLTVIGPYTGVAPTPIPIDVSGCEPGTRLSVALTGTPPAGMPASSGVVQSTGTEPNVAVQILNNDTTFDPTDISGNSPRDMGRVPSGGATLSTTYYARYYALGQAQGGRVKAGLTFTLTYP